MRAFNFKIRDRIAVGIVAVVAMQGIRSNRDFMPRALLVRQTPRRQLGMVVADTDRTVVSAKSAMDDLVAHGQRERRVAWLK